MSDVSCVLYKAQLERKEAWDNCVKIVDRFSSLEVFKSNYQKYLPTALDVDMDYHFFKDGYLPDWSHPANKHGGRYVIQHDLNDDNLNKVWLDVVEFILTSESLPGGHSVVGALVKVRARNGFKRTISIWMSSASTIISRTLIAKELKAKLNLPKIYFGLHTELEARSMRNKERRENSENFDATLSKLENLKVACEPARSWRSSPKKPAEKEVKSWRSK